MATLLKRPVKHRRHLGKKVKKDLRADRGTSINEACNIQRKKFSRNLIKPHGHGSNAAASTHIKCQSTRKHDIYVQSEASTVETVSSPGVTTLLGARRPFCGVYFSAVPENICRVFSPTAPLRRVTNVLAWAMQAALMRLAATPRPF